MDFKYFEVDGLFEESGQFSQFAFNMSLPDVVVVLVRGGDFDFQVVIVVRKEVAFDKQVAELALVLQYFVENVVGAFELPLNYA